MTAKSRSFFIAAILPCVQDLAARRSAGIENVQDREDDMAEFIGDAWEHYVALADQEPEPALCRVLCALYRPEPVWTHRLEPDFKVLSMGNPRIRRMAECVPA